MNTGSGIVLDRTDVCYHVNIKNTRFLLCAPNFDLSNINELSLTCKTKNKLRPMEKSPFTLQSSLPDTSIEGSVREKSTLQARFSCSSYSITLCKVKNHFIEDYQLLMTGAYTITDMFVRSNLQENNTWRLENKSYHLYLPSRYIPDSYYPIIITASNMGFCVLIPTQATKLRSCGHFNNRTVHIRWFIHNLQKTN